MNPHPAVSQGTSLQCCAEHDPAAPTEMLHSLDELLKGKQQPLETVSAICHGRAGLDSEHLDHLRTICLSRSHLTLLLSALCAVAQHL